MCSLFDQLVVQELAVHLRLTFQPHNTYYVPIYIPSSPSLFILTLFTLLTLFPWKTCLHTCMDYTRNSHVRPSVDHRIVNCRDPGS